MSLAVGRKRAMASSMSSVTPSSSSGHVGATMASIVRVRWYVTSDYDRNIHAVSIALHYSKHGLSQPLLRKPMLQVHVHVQGLLEKG